MMTSYLLGALQNFQSSPFVRNLSIAASVGRTSIHNCLSRLEKKRMTMNNCDFRNVCCFSCFYYCFLMHDIYFRRIYSNHIQISYVLFYSTFWCGLGINLNLLIFCCVYYETFCYQDWSIFFSVSVYLVLILTFIACKM